MAGPVRKLVLASASPRRRALLGELGWSFEVRVAEVDETPRNGETPGAMALRLASAKARDVADRMRREGECAGVVFLGADTVVVLGEAVLGKPRDRDDARRMLRTLSGREHTVLTAITLVGEECERSALESTQVTFRPLDDAAVDAYAATGEGDDKAGAYAIQGHGALLVERISGCYFNVVGLPLHRLSVLLDECGWNLSQQWRMEAMP
ncbi:Maf family protein [Aminiphilus circumscriptus]|uniref:Maf family protein n=1 Tax=Aminiphilus circumscriptus TaxID=290732 RepID=UPI001B7FB6A8|nr:Maf family protein [Aminiphilus circumscriptus]